MGKFAIGKLSDRQAQYRQDLQKEQNRQARCTHLYLKKEVFANKLLRN